MPANQPVYHLLEEEDGNPAAAGILNSSVVLTRPGQILTDTASQAPLMIKIPKKNSTHSREPAAIHSLVTLKTEASTSYSFAESSIPSSDQRSTSTPDGNTSDSEIIQLASSTTSSSSAATSVSDAAAVSSPRNLNPTASSSSLSDSATVRARSTITEGKSAREIEVLQLQMKSLWKEKEMIEQRSKDDRRRLIEQQRKIDKLSEGESSRVEAMKAKDEVSRQLRSAFAERDDARSALARSFQEAVKLKRSFDEAVAVRQSLDQQLQEALIMVQTSAKTQQEVTDNIAKTTKRCAALELQLSDDSKHSLAEKKDAAAKSSESIGAIRAGRKIKLHLQSPF